MANVENGQKIKEIALKTLSDLVDEETAEIILEEAYINLPELKKDLLETISSNNLEDATRFAHSIKGVMSTMGLPEAAEAAKQCEHKLKVGDRDIDEPLKELFITIDDLMATRG